MKIKHVLLLISFFLAHSMVYGQDEITVSGTVSDDLGPLAGASVVVKGTTTGTQTDFDGNFTLDNVPSDGTLVVSYIGFSAQELAVDGQTSINVTLAEDAEALDEVVVIGYGEMKSKDLTSAITTIKAEEIAATPTSQAMQALQGKVAGLQIVSNGSPGQGPTVRVRGLGSYLGGASSPLYVVDGVFFDNIDFLNTADVASMSVLKDASAAAIYGVRAANGVILIETKSGTYNQKAEITYDGYSGYQVAQNVLKLANSEQFVTLALESGSEPDAQFIQNAFQRFGRSRINPNVPDVNTDWYDEIIRLGIMQNHNIGISGGGEDVKYSIGANYFGQQGILKMKNEYQRFNLRAKIDAKATDWLTLGANLVMSNALRFDPQNQAWRAAYYAVPILPVLDPLNIGAFPKNYSNASILGYRGSQNPFPAMDLNENRLKIRQYLVSFYAQAKLAENLVFKTAYNHDFQTINERGISLPFNLNNGSQNELPDINRRNTITSNQIWDNTLTYSNDFGKHNVTALLGSSFRNENFEFLRGSAEDFPLKEESYFISQSLVVPANQALDGAAQEFGLSFFSRLAYNYDNRYLLYGTFRADGVRKFEQKWGYFPTIGLGWVVSEENFMQNNGFLDFLKFRASWGELGNDKVPSQSGAFTSDVVITAFGDQQFSGLLTNSDFSILNWEVVEEQNYGLTARTFDSRLSLEADYYIRDTKNAIIPVERPLIPGTVLQNVGVIRNSGLEFVANWSDAPSEDFSYNVGLNLSLMSNEVLDLGGPEFLDAGSAEFRQRSIVGEPLFAFFGREVDGIYQNQAEIDADQAAQSEIAADRIIEPGDFKYKENGGDPMTIDADDRVVLGSYLPSHSYGFNVGFNFKGWDFSAATFGQGGNKILNRKRLEVIFTNDTNWDRDFAVNRWHGEGTTNTYPSSKAVRKQWNQNLNDYYVEDGDFFRIQNITLGYTINKSGEMPGIPKTRIYLTAERPYTSFNYNGFNPEVNNGVDNQTYPIPAIYTIGVNVKI